MESGPACLVCLLWARFKGESVLVLSVLHIYRISLFPFPSPSFLFSFFFFFFKDLCLIVLPFICPLPFHLSSPRLVSLVACAPLPYTYRIVSYHITIRSCLPNKLTKYFLSPQLMIRLLRGWFLMLVLIPPFYTAVGKVTRHRREGLRSLRF